MRQAVGLPRPGMAAPLAPCPCAAAVTVLELSAEAGGVLGSPLFPQCECLFPCYHKGHLLQSLTLAASFLPYNMHIALR